MCLIIACSKKEDDAVDDNPITEEMTFTSFSPTSGEAGVTTVTLTGTNFSTTPSENSVKFGMATATVTDAKANELQVTVPETAETGTISVTTNGTKVTSTDTFTVEDPEPQMTITGFDPMEGEWGTEITISGTNFRETVDVVTVNARDAEIVSRTSTEIVIKIPDARTGSIIVYDDANNQHVESENDLTVFHGRWTQLEDFEGIARVNASTFSINGKGYVGLGVTNGVEEIKDFWEYDPESDHWVEKAQFDGLGRHYPISIAIADKGYVGLGNSFDFGSDLDDFWEYDPSSDEWTERKSFDGGKRKGAIAFSFGDNGYVGTGFRDLGGGEYEYLKDFWEYSPDNNIWNKKTDFGGTARENALAFSVGSMGYTAMGYDEENGSLSDFWEYDYENDTWSKANISAPNDLYRYSGVAFSIEGKGYIGLGKDGNNYFVDFWEYFPVDNEWVRVADFKGDGRTGAAVFVIDGKAYLGLGSSGEGELKDFWVFDPGN
ncbi:IPT/TIG domain-containing protein [Flagellimonas flava]|nr:IPT/TIG domain-containing protein [Allomuricauda flava]